MDETRTQEDAALSHSDSGPLGPLQSALNNSHAFLTHSDENYFLDLDICVDMPSDSSASWEIVCFICFRRDVCNSYVGFRVHSGSTHCCLVTR